MAIDSVFQLADLFWVSKSRWIITFTSGAIFIGLFVVSRSEVNSNQWVIVLPTH